MLGLSQGGKGKAAGLSLPHLCSVSSTRQERLGTPACPRAEAAGTEEWLRLQALQDQCREVGAHKKPTLHASLHEDMASFLLEELRQHPLSKL